MEAEQDEEEVDETEQKLQKLTEIREKLKKKTGRLWTDPLDIDDVLEAGETFEQLQEFSPELVSRISQERLKLYEKDGSKIPLVKDLADLPLPPGPVPHPGEGNTMIYALQRKRLLYQKVAKRVEELAEPKIAAIQSLSDWQDKQDAVDVMFEDIEFTLKGEMEILGLQPQFGQWVEKALEAYLRRLRKEGKEAISADEDSSDAKTVDEASEDAAKVPDSKIPDEDAVPVFMDCYNPDDGEQEEPARKRVEVDATIPKVVPTLLHPLRQHHKGKPSIARMVEEWELAAHKTTKRIMLRQSTRAIARALIKAEETSNAARIFVHGRFGTGKSAALIATVACARKSGYIVLYLVEGDMLTLNFYFIEPNTHRKGIFDLPLLTQNTCADMLKTHRDDMIGMHVDESAFEEFFSESQLEEYKKNQPDDPTSVISLFEEGAKTSELAPMCYSTAVDYLMKQEDKPFLIVADEYNCYHKTPGHFFHEEYDSELRKTIPCDQVSLFKPFMDAMAVPSITDEDFKVEKPPVVMKRGGVIVATTESHAVLRQTTQGLIANAKEMAGREDNENLTVVEIPRLTKLETEHMLSNYESIGIGKLLLDRGETVMNDNEVEYFRCVSGGEAQRLMDAVIIMF